MGELGRISRRLQLRWAVPGAVMLVAGAVLAGTVLASAASPALPHRTPAQLLAAMRHASAPPAMSAVVVQTANLGLPALPDLPGVSSSALSASALLAGSHMVQLWYAGPRHLRIALPVSFGETDLRVNGSQVWLWDSQGQKATRYLAPASPIPGPSAPARAPGAKSQSPGATSLAPAGDPFAGMTPLQAARQVLALAGKATAITDSGTVEVAGRPAYQLAIAPRSGRSLIGRILIAVDASTYLPLEVQVFARGASSPAFQVGFTSLSFARPAMSNFAFTPPPGAHVRTVRLKAPPSRVGLRPGGSGPGSFGPGSFGPGGFGPGSFGPGRIGQVLGTGWLAVAAFSAGQPPGTAQPGDVGQPGSHTQAGSHTQPGSLPALLIKAATPVHGTWGSGRLLRTSLLSVLITSKGQVLVGAVTPAVLYADVALVGEPSRPR